MINKIWSLINRNKLILLLFAWTLHIRLTYISFFFDKDIYNRYIPKVFDDRALTMASGETFAYPAGWGSYYIPLAFIYKLFDLVGLLGDRLLLLAIINSILAAISVVFVYKIAKILFENSQKLQLAIPLILSVYYPGIYLNLLNVSENFFTPFLTILFYQLLKAKKMDIIQAFLIGLNLGFLSMLRPVAFTLLPALLIWFVLVKKWNIKQHIKFYSAMIFSFTIVLLVVSLINYNFDKNKNFATTGNIGFNFALTWCPAKRILHKQAENEYYWFSPPVYQKRSDLINFISPEPFYNQTYFIKTGLSCIYNNPKILLENAINIKNLYFSQFYPNLIKNNLHLSLMSIWRLIAVPLTLGFILYLFAFKTGRNEWKLAGLVMLSLFISVYLGNPGEERYLIPYYFLLLIFGFSTISALFSKKQLLLLGIVLIPALIVSITLFKNIPSSEDKKTNNEVLLAFKKAVYWLRFNMTENFSFIYLFDLSTMKREEGDNLTRQLLTSQALANAAVYSNSMAVLDLHKDNLAFLNNLLLKEDKYYYIKGKSEHQSTINQNAFAVMTLIDSPYNTKYVDEMGAIGEFLLKMQKNDGYFYMLYPIEQSKKLSEIEDINMQKFGSGEAALACIKLYEFLGDKRYLDCAEKAYEYYYPRIQNDFNPSFGSWHTIAYAKLYQITKKEKYRQAVNFMADKIIEFQNKPEDLNLMPGGFDKKGKYHTSAEAVFIEALGFAYRINKNEESGKRYYEANLSGIKHLIALQIGSNETREIAGAIKADQDVESIMVDNVGHSLMAFYEFLTR